MRDKEDPSFAEAEQACLELRTSLRKLAHRVNAEKMSTRPVVLEDDVSTAADEGRHSAQT
jgi:hypothetical protein